jgi:hypothetical protein
MAISSTAFGTLNKAISAYTDEAYTRAKKLVSTGIMGSDASINPNGEDFIGQIRFYKPLGSYAVGGTTNEGQSIAGGAATTVNVASQDENYGATTNISTSVETYIKTVRTHGANEYLLQEFISKQDGMAKIARDFSETRAEDEDQALRACLTGIRGSELAVGNALQAAVTAKTLYSQVFAGNAVDGDPAKAFGYVAAAADTIGTGSGLEKLVDISQAIPGKRVEHIIRAMGAWADYAPSFVYLVVGPETYLDIKVANLVDDERVTDGNVSFETILSGQVRIIVSRSFSAVTAATNVALGSNSTSPKTSYMMLPGSMFMSQVSVPNPVAMDRNENVGSGSGRTTAWYRWGYVMHPRGYTFAGTQTAFATNAVLGAAASWTRQASILNLGILPIFHV